MAPKKEDVVKIVGMVASMLGIAGSLLSSWSSHQQMKATVAEEVAKAFENKQ